MYKLSKTCHPSDVLAIFKHNHLKNTRRVCVSVIISPITHGGHRKYLEQACVQRSKFISGHQGWAGGRGKEVSVLWGQRASVQGDGNIWEWLMVMDVFNVTKLYM